MLDGEELKYLEKALSPPGPDGLEGGSLYGKTYAEIAEVLNQRDEKRREPPVTPRSVRYYVDYLVKARPVRGLRRPPRGWPKGKKRNQERGGKQFPWAFLYAELLALTGLSAAQLHAELAALRNGPENFLPLRTFVDHLKRYGRIEARRSKKPKTRQVLSETCSLRLHQLALTIDPGHNYWAILGAYEPYTRYIHVEIFDIRLDGAVERKRGRPKKVPSGDIQALVRRQEEWEYLELSSELWMTFCEETIRRLGLPVAQIEYVSEFGLAPGSLEFGNAMIKLSSACVDGMSRVPCHQVPGVSLPALRERLAAYGRQSNQKHEPALEELRRRVKEALQAAEAMPRVLGKPKSVEVREREELRAYYQGNNLRQPLLPRSLCRPKIILGSLEISTNLSTQAGNDAVPSNDHLLSEG